MLNYQFLIIKLPLYLQDYQTINFLFINLNKLNFLFYSNLVFFLIFFFAIILDDDGQVSHASTLTLDNIDEIYELPIKEKPDLLEIKYSWEFIKHIQHECTTRKRKAVGHDYGIAKEKIDSIIVRAKKGPSIRYKFLLLDSLLIDRFECEVSAGKKYKYYFTI